MLLVIVANTDTKGYSWISQEKIGELVGLCRQQVGKIIKDLMDNEFAGRVLLKGIKVKTVFEKRNYFYNPFNCYLEKIFANPDQISHDEGFDDNDENVLESALD